jgi:uncharacterized membrane protein HdeD (DUF308 family)
VINPLGCLADCFWNFGGRFAISRGRSRQRVRLIWKLLVGLAYLFFGAYLMMHPVLGVATLTLVLASLFLIEGILDIVLFFQMPQCGDRAGCWLMGSSPSC